MKTSLETALTALAAIISAGVVFASGFLWYLRPERPWPSLLAIAIVCCGWTARHLSRGDGQADPRAQAKRRKITRAIVVSGWTLGFALAGALMARLGWK